MVRKVIGAKNTKKVLETIQTGLKVLSSQTEKLMQLVENLEKEEAQAAKKQEQTGTAKKPEKKPKKKPETKAAKKARTPKADQARAKAPQKTATDQVIEIIQNANRPLNVADLSEMTGFEQKKVQNIVSKAARQGRINRAGRGLYVST